MSLNSDQFSFNDIRIYLNGIELNSINGVEVEHGWEHQAYIGKGGRRQGINETEYTVDGTLKMLQSDLEAIMESYGEHWQKKYFNIIWVFDPDGSENFRTHIIKRLKLGKVKQALNQGDAFMEVDVPFMACGIKLNQ